MPDPLPLRRARLRRIPGASLAVAAWLLAAGAGLAGPREPAAEGDEEMTAPLPPEREIRLRVSGWAAGWGGDVAARGAATDVNAGLGESFELENLGAAAEVDVRWRRFLLVAGGSWSDLDDDLETRPHTATFGPALLDLALLVPELPASLFALSVPELRATLGAGDVDVDVQHVEAELLLGYRLVTTPLPGWLGGTGRKEARRFDFDLLAGVRYHDLETRIDARIPAAEVDPFVATAFLREGPRLFDVLIPSSPELVDALSPLFDGDVDLQGAELPGASLAGLRRRFEANAHWLDPVLGVRLGLDVSPCLRLRLRGDVGGFGLGSASDFAWTAELALVARLAEHVEAELAWRAAGLDRDRGAGAIDVLDQGPRVGLSLRF